MNRLIPLLSVILLVAALLGTYYFWVPQYQRAAILSIQLEKKRETVKQNEDYLKQLNDMEISLSSYSEELSKISAALPTDVSMPSLFNFIQKETSDNGLILSGISYGSAAAIPAVGGDFSIKKIPFSITAQGSYGSLKNFLDAVYKNSRIINVESISFGSGSGSSSGASATNAGKTASGIFNFKIDLAAFAL